MIKSIETNKNANNNVDELKRIWLGIKNDYRTLIGLEGVNVVDSSTNIDDVEDDDE